MFCLQQILVEIEVVVYGCDLESILRKSLPISSGNPSKKAKLFGLLFRSYATSSVSVMPLGKIILAHHILSTA